MAGDIPAARAHLQAAAQAPQQIGWEDPDRPAALGYVLRAEKDRRGARSAFEAALRIGRRNGSNSHMASAIAGRACVADDAGDWDRAATGTAPRRRFRTGPAIPGSKTIRVTAGTAWTKRVPA